MSGKPRRRDGPDNPHKTVKDSTFKPKPDGPDPRRKVWDNGDLDPDMTFGKKPGKDDPDMDPNEVQKKLTKELFSDNNNDNDPDPAVGDKGPKIIHLVDSKNPRSIFATKPKIPGVAGPDITGSDTAMRDRTVREQQIADMVVKQREKDAKKKALDTEKADRKKELDAAWEQQQKLYPKPEKQEWE